MPIVDSSTPSRRPAADRPHPPRPEPPSPLGPATQPASIGPSTASRSRALQAGFGFAVLALLIITAFLLRDFVGAFVLGSLLAFLISPLVDRVQALGMPRGLVIVIVLAGLAALVAAFVGLLAPLLVEEVGQLKAQLPAIAEQAQVQVTRLEGEPLIVFGYQVDLTGYVRSADSRLREFLLGQFGNALGIGVAALTIALQVLLMLVVAFLLTMDSHRVLRFIRRLTPIEYRDDFDVVWGQVRSMLYGYVRGQLVIAAMIGLASAVAVALLGVKFALALGLIAAAASLIPYLGPFLGAVPAVLVALAHSPQQALLTALTYLVISNVILNFVYPKIVGDAVRLRPLLVIVALIAGFGLAGVLGMFVAVPVAAALRILYDHLQPRIYGEAAPG